MQAFGTYQLKCSLIHGGDLYGGFIGDTLVIHGDCQ
jgi:hypothetical protein